MHEISNLQRQFLFDEEDIVSRLPKVVAAKNKLEKINSDANIEAIFDNVDDDNIDSFIGDFDLVLDGTDNFPTRLLINKACVYRKIPFIYGAVAASFGMVYNVIPGSGVCLKCLFSEEPAGENFLSCNTVGIINTAVSIVASIQSIEALKFLTGNRDSVTEGLINVDIWNLSIEVIKVERDDNYLCQICGSKK